MLLVQRQVIRRLFQRKAHQNAAAAVVEPFAAAPAEAAEHSVRQAGEADDLYLRGTARPQKTQHGALAFKRKLLRHQQHQLLFTLPGQPVQLLPDKMCFSAPGAPEQQMKQPNPPFRKVRPARRSTFHLSSNYSIKEP